MKQQRLPPSKGGSLLLWLSSKALVGYSSITTMQKYYLQVDNYHRAKAAAMIESLVSGANGFENTGARMTAEGSFTQKIGRGQS
ncbi:MAG: hypothetical protein FVQ85_20970 [Planctomycetes bacterium]|nr:hypothetical protein [Planctomycetota bacterium]